MALLFEHIDRIHAVTGSYDNIGSGSDMDGFIRPSLKGLDTPEDYNSVKYRLIDKYGGATADKICWQNALRVLQWWRS
jgi:microsomal dipeptidase-like Zn-dependent dipeptidase